MKMENKIESFGEPHHWFLEMDFSSSKKYDQYINWLRMEYYFFQQDHGSFLTIYFPNGYMKIEKKAKPEDTFVSEITVESACKKFGLKIWEKLSAFLVYMDKYQRLSQISG